jgi:predicted RNA-binding Zn-ribbon protein involved in translation (DUF1610 family)
MHISGSETDTWKTKDRVKQSPLIIKNVYVVFHDMYDCPLCGEQKVFRIDMPEFHSQFYRS